MRFELEVHSADDLQAFSVFLAAAASNRRRAEDEIAAARQHRIAQLGTDRTGPVDIAEIDAARHVGERTAEPEPAAAPAPAEKKTRSRKAKDAPVVSVSSVDNGGQKDLIEEIKALAAEGEKQFEADRQQAAISTGEERIGPEDSPEVVAQDEADEKAESDAARDPAKPLTLDDVRVAMGAYATAYGMDAALADGPAIYNKALGPVPDGTKNAKGEVVKEWCLTATPLDQESLAKTVQYWQAALTENPFKHTKVAA